MKGAVNMNTKTANNTYSPTFRKYLNDLFVPAQDWALSDDGSTWIKKNIPTLSPLIEKHYDDCLFSVYCLRLNGKPLYVGESIRTIRRLCAHAYNICHNPELFGLDEESIGKNNISVELLEKFIYAEGLRKSTERHYISTLQPILQKADGTDSCISRSKRAEAVLAALNKAV